MLSLRDDCWNLARSNRLRTHGLAISEPLHVTGDPLVIMDREASSLMALNSSLEVLKGDDHDGHVIKASSMQTILHDTARTSS